MLARRKCGAKTKREGAARAGERLGQIPSSMFVFVCYYSLLLSDDLNDHPSRAQSLSEKMGLICAFLGGARARSGWAFGRS